MVDWVDICADRLQRARALVIVSIASVKGSSPREVGARMLVTRLDTDLTIGGGNLEYQCIDIARKLLEQNEDSHFQRFSLAAGLGQCCGGVVTVLFEKVHAESGWVGKLQKRLLHGEPVMQVIALESASTLPHLLVSAQHVEPAWAEQRYASIIERARQRLAQRLSCGIQGIQVDSGEAQALLFDPVRVDDFNLLLFGAGHVGSALVSMLAQQPCRVSWIDTRDHILPQETASNIETVCTDIPQALVDAAAPGSYFLVMTHDHRLDQQLAEQILKRNDFAWFGMIGSRSKRARFTHRLRARGIESSVLQKMVCPIGIGGIKSKLPSAIAVSVLAQLLQAHERQAQPEALQWGHEQTR